MHKYPIQKELLTTSPRSAQVNAVRRKATKRYKQYQPKDITAALYLVATSQASIIQAAKQFNIPTRTLYQRIYNIKKLYALGRETPNQRPGLCRSGQASRSLPEGQRSPDPEEIWSTPEHIVIKLEPYLLDPPRVDSPQVSSTDEFKVNELPTSGGDAEGVELCDSEGLKNLMLTSLHASSLRVPSTLMSQ